MPPISNIRDLSHDKLVETLKSIGQPSYRAKQVEQWLFGKGVSSFGEMSNLPKDLREQLEQLYSAALPRMVAREESQDGTRKYLFEFDDGVCVESVGMPGTKDKLSICVSTQAGCAMGCIFCATGRSGLVRSLSPSEIYSQVLLVGKDFECRPTSVVVMGQGEPFTNYDATLRALRLINSPDYLNVGARHITISTCGILPGIARLATEPEQFTLAVSLHAAIQETRDRIMPGVAGFPLAELKEELIAYTETTGRRVSFEVALISDLNDDDRHLESLVSYCRGLLCHVNLIPLNPTSPEQAGDTLVPTSRDRVETFRSTLSRSGIETTVRNSRGTDISGACGQLRQRKLDAETAV